VAKIAFLFPGQGAQRVGMGKVISSRFPAAKALYDQANEILGYDLAALCFEGPVEKLDTTVISQPALFVSSLAALEMLRAENPSAVENCAMAAGLSLGEYTALVFAGAMSFEDGLRVVQRRGEAMQQAADANPSGMVSALVLDHDQVAKVRDDASAAGQIWIANYLCPGNTVLSGDKPACAKAAELIEAAGGGARVLTVAGAFHTPLMSSACGRLEDVLRSVQISSPRIPVVSNVDAKPHTGPERVREILVRQVTQPVLWEGCVRELISKLIDRKADCQTINDD
jgi:[acyl-carrier-protein] S-malonyltransferase